MNEDQFNKSVSEIPYSAALFEVVRPLSKEYIDSTVPFHPKSKRRVNPVLNIGDLVYFERGKEYGRKRSDHKTIWGSWWLHDSIEFVGYESIVRDIEIK